MSKQARSYRTRWIWVIRLLGLALLIFLVVQFDISRVLMTLRQANLYLIGAALSGMFPMIWLKTVRWHVMLRNQGISLPLQDAYQAYFSSIFIGVLTPGRLGEFVKTLYVSEKSPHSTAHALSSVLADRLFDLYLLVAVGSVALLRLATGSFLLLVVALTPILTVPLWLFLHKKTFHRVQSLGLKFGKPGQRLFGPKGWLTDLHTGLRQIDGKTFLIAAFITLLAYCVFFSQCYLLARAINIQADYSTIMFSVALGSLVTLIPVSISGLGTREASIIAYLSLSNVSPEVALSLSFLIFFTFYLGGGFIGGIAWLLKPVPLAILRTTQTQAAMDGQNAVDSD